MSLILEALRKSDAERRLGSAPDLLAPMPVLRTPPPRRPWRLAVAAALLLVAIVVIVGWWSTTRTIPPPNSAPSNSAPIAAPLPPHAQYPTPAPNAQPAVQQELAPATVVSQPTQPPPPVTLPTTKPARAVVLAPSPNPSSLKQAPLAPAPRTRAADADATNHQTVITVAPISVPTEMAHTSKPSISTSANAPAPSEPPTATNAPASNPPAPTDEPALLSLADLAAGERNSLPALKVTMHVYAEQPARRFMIVDGKRVGEGAHLGDGIILVHIRHDGAEIDAHGQRLLLPKP